MMAATPLIWAIGWIGGFSVLLGGVGTLVAPSAGESLAAGGFGLLGFLLALAPIAWWVWGMLDAKRLCEGFNETATATRSAVPTGQN